LWQIGFFAHFRHDRQLGQRIAKSTGQQKYTQGRGFLLI
jgi:hypothetical protein